MTGTKVLIVDDEENIRELVKFNLVKEGFCICEAVDGGDALSKVRKDKPQLIILDLMLPIMDGLEVCKILKKQNETGSIPIIMLTAKGEEIDKILGLEIGADDYLTKPFSPRELIARVKAVLRRTKREMYPEGEMKIGDLRLNFSRYEAYVKDTKIELTPKEFELLKLFITNIGKVMTRDYLLEKIWGYEYFGDSRTVDVHIRHLRSKISINEELANSIETVRGVGYRFKEA